MALIRKKKVELDDQFAVYRERESPRFASDGSISIAGFDGEGRIKNISVSGCCMESVTYAALVPNQEYRITLRPEAGINMESFSITLEASWTRSSETRFEAGFALKGARTDSSLERYAARLESGGVPPEYGNMPPAHRKS